MKKGLIAFSILIGVLFIVFIVFVVKDLKVEAKLTEIVDDLANQEEIDMNIQTTGSYAVIEKAIKLDYKEFYKLLDKLNTEYGNPALENSLSANNISKDGPNFLTTRADLEKLKTSRKTIHEEMLKITSDDEVNRKIGKYKLDEYDAELYNKYIGGLSLIISEVVKDDKAFDESINVVVEILDFLQQEKSHWTVEGSDIVFDSQELLDKYRFLVNKVCYDCNEEETDSSHV